MTLRTQLLANKVEHVFHPATNASPEAKAAVTQIVINTHEALDSESKKELIAVVTKAVSILPASAQVEFVKYAKQADPASLPDSNETDSKDDQPSNELPSQDKLFGAEEVAVNPTTSTNTEVSTELESLGALFGAEEVAVNPTTSTNTEVSTELASLDALFGAEEVAVNPTTSTNTEVSTELASLDALFGDDPLVMVSNTSSEAGTN